jgi:ABC-type dipeptide/oligopeptide/nickel transport system permease subunit
MKKFFITYLIFIMGLAWLTPWFSQSWEIARLDEVLLAPSLNHFFGTDSLGRDLFHRTLVGGQISLFICLIASLGALAIGFLMGGISALSHRWFDLLTVRLIEIFISLPYLIVISLLAVLFQALFPLGGAFNILAALVLAGWVSSARFIRNLVLKEMHETYVEAARALGNSKIRILFYHILPNIRSQILIFWGLQIPQAILAEGVLSFIGLGVKAPAVSWGQLLQEGWRMLAHYPHLLMGPALVFSLTILSFNWILDDYRKTLRLQTQSRENYH